MLNPNDDRHEAAAAEFADLLSANEPLETHAFVLVETVALAQRRMGVPAVAAIRNDLMPAMRVEWPSEELFDTALASLVASGRRAISLVDELSFETMRRRGLRRAFAFDAHFAQRGFELVPADQ